MAARPEGATCESPEAINLGMRLASFREGMCPITTMFDGFGDETDEANEAVCVVCAVPGGGYTVVETADYQKAVLQ